jgi:hypothetical protein
VKIKSGINDILWLAAGVVVLLICMLGVLHLHEDQDPAAQLARRARRVELVGRMQLDLASASEAEKSAVLATSDLDSQTFADQARAASVEVEKERRELDELLATTGTERERALSVQFATAFAQFQRVDDELLALAVKNTNVKAYSVAFGPLAAAVKEMNASLDRLVEANADSPEARRVTLLALGAETSALRLQTLLPPHIAEEDDTKMDALEALMATEDAHARKSLESLAALPRLGKDPELATAITRNAEVGHIRSQVLALSRENTNVRSLSISLNEKRRVMLVCQGALGALHDAIVAEPVAGATNGPPAKPR